jgi:hypothetical protein
MEGCNNSNMAINQYFRGIRYCHDHYQGVFSMEMENLWQAWEKDYHPPERFMYLIGRWYTEFERACENKPFLTQGMVMYSSFNWKKTQEGAIFTIVRRTPDRRTRGSIIRLVHDTWSFDLQNKAFTFLRQRKG